MMIEAMPGGRLTWPQIIAHVLFMVFLYFTHFAPWIVYTLLALYGIRLFWHMLYQREDAFLMENGQLEIRTSDFLKIRKSKTFDLEGLKYYISTVSNKHTTQRTLHIYYNDKHVSFVVSGRNGWDDARIDEIVAGLQAAGVPMLEIAKK